MQLSVSAQTLSDLVSGNYGCAVEPDHVFTKTGTGRQAELVKLASSLVTLG